MVGDKGGGIGTVAFGTNDLGQIVGYYITGGRWKGFLYSGGTNGTYTTLPDDPSAGGGPGVAPLAINDSGQIVGYYNDSNGSHGFLYSNGIYTTLAVPGGTNILADGINDAGQVVGWYFDSSGIEHGFLYSGGTNGTYTTLDDPSTTPGTIMVGPHLIAGTAAAGINDLGQIVGYYHDLSGIRGFLASPLSPLSPASIISVTDNVAPLTGTLANRAYTNDPDPTVQVSLSGTGALAGDTVQLYNGTGTGSPLGNSYRLTSTDISNGFANVQPGTLTNGTTYTLTARITDAAGNQSAVSTNSFTLTEDTATPTVAVSISSSDVNLAANTATVTFVFSDATTDFSILGSTTAIGGTLSNLQTNNGGNTYTATFTAASGTDISNASVSVLAGSYHGPAGVAGTGGNGPVHGRYGRADSERIDRQHCPQRCPSHCASDVHVQQSAHGFLIKRR